MLNAIQVDLSEISSHASLLPSCAQEKIFDPKNFITSFRVSFRRRNYASRYVKLQNKSSIDRKNLLNTLRKKIKFAEGIESSLAERNDVLTLLTSVMSKIDKYFPNDTTTFFLRKSYDLNSKAFVLEVQSRQDYTKAKQAFDDFDDDWWLDYIPQSNDVLIIGLSTL